MQHKWYSFNNVTVRSEGTEQAIVITDISTENVCEMIKVVIGNHSDDHAHGVDERDTHAQGGIDRNDAEQYVCEKGN
jgi:hypothetical protein